MYESLPVAAKHLVLGESLEEKEEERVATRAWSFVKELKTGKQIEKQTAPHAWVMMMEQHLLFIQHHQTFFTKAPQRGKWSELYGP